MQKPPGVVSRCGRALAALALLAPLGCRQQPALGEVSGQVTVAGAPVQYGTIGFLSAEGRVSAAPVSNGAYKAVGVPTGKATVTVSAVKMGAPAGHPTLGPLPSMEAPGKFVPVPERYALPKTSDLKFEVQPGPQSKDFDLLAE